MSVVKFKTNSSGNSIERVQVLRETAQSVYLPALGYQARDGKSERREAKISDYVQYHDTWTDAHAYLLEKAERVVKSARQQLEAANGRLGNIKGMKPPKEVA